MAQTTVKTDFSYHKHWPHLFMRTVLVHETCLPGQYQPGLQAHEIFSLIKHCHRRVSQVKFLSHLNKNVGKPIKVP